jgi:hypothetical protein
LPRTLESTREFDETIVNPEDEEVKEDEATDEFAEYFKGNVTPKIFVTTSINPSAVSSHKISCQSITECRDVSILLAILLMFSQIFITISGELSISEIFANMLEIKVLQI